MDEKPSKGIPCWTRGCQHNLQSPSDVIKKYLFRDRCNAH